MTTDRRGLLALGMAAGLAPRVSRARAASPKSLEAAPWTREIGAPILSPPYGQPSAFEKGVVRKARRTPMFGGAASSGAPLHQLHGIITPGGLHFERHHGGVPAIDPDRHQLMIHGLVDRPMTFTMDALMRFPSVSRIHFIECSGNTPFIGGLESWTAQDTHGLMSCSEWTGVRLADLLDEVGVKPGATWLLAEGADAAKMSRSVPIEKALDDAVLAYAQNGEALRPEQGYPLRLVLPGFEGNMNIKWLRRLKLGDQPFQTREETSRYTDLLPDGRALQFTFLMAAKSVITRPSSGHTLSGPGFHEISGVAWSGRGCVRRVEVSTDAGRSWRDARLQEPVLPKCLTRFTAPWTWDGGRAELQSRVTDETGYVQPMRETLIGRVGLNSGYHNNAVHGWRVAPSGAVSNAV